jgi:hypothetical protein
MRHDLEISRSQHLWQLSNNGQYVADFVTKDEALRASMRIAGVLTMKGAIVRCTLQPMAA